MSIKGFKVGSAAAEQYDYNYLDNKPDLSVYATKTEVAAVDDAALAAFPTDTATGAVASFADGADGIPMKSIVCTINPTQSGSGDPSPSNIRPISGFTGLTLSHSGEDTSDPTTLSVSWQTEAGTVYGGTLDIVSGVLTVTMVSADAGDIGWTRYDLGDNWAFYHSFNDMERGTAGDAPDFLVSNYKAVESASRTAFLNNGADLTAAHVDNGKAIYIKDTSISTKEAFKTAMAGQTIVYTLETPVTYQLTAQEVDSLLGTNNVWCDTGDTTVNYRADTALYIAKKIAEATA